MATPAVTFSVDVEGLERSIHSAVADALDKIVIDLQRELKLMLSKPGTGRVYFKGRKRKRLKSGRMGKWTGGRRHRASAPGEPPAAQTGFLRNSWGVGSNSGGVDKSDLNNKRRPRLRLGSNVVYAAAMEYGYEPNNLAPRPYIRPTIEAYTASGRAEKRVVAAIVKALPKVRRR